MKTILNEQVDYIQDTVTKLDNLKSFCYFCYNRHRDTKCASCTTHEYEKFLTEKFEFHIKKLSDCINTKNNKS